MIKFRKELDPKTRFDLRDEIFEIIKNGSTIHYDRSRTLQELEDLVQRTTEAFNSDPESLLHRTNRNVALSLLRDFKYANRKYNFLRGVTFNGLITENYKSADKLLNLQ